MKIASWQSAFIVAIFVAIAFSIIVFEPFKFFGSNQETRKRLEIAELCTRVLDETQRIGIKSKIDVKGNFDIDMGVLQDEKGTANEKIVERVLECIEKAYAQEKFENTFVTKKPLPLGLVAQQWENGEPNLYLDRPNNKNAEIILNNMWFGPKGGDKRTLISNWCNYAKNCVSCSPSPNEKSFWQATSIQIKLLDCPTVNKVKMWGKWNNPVDPWELVDEHGNRYLYKCEGGPKCSE